jgi:hypothetical protein
MGIGDLFKRKKKEKEEIEDFNVELLDDFNEYYAKYINDHSMSEANLSSDINEITGRRYYYFNEGVIDGVGPVPSHNLLTVGTDKETGLPRMVLGGDLYYPFIVTYIDLKFPARISFDSDNTSFDILRGLTIPLLHDRDPKALKSLEHALEQAKRALDDSMFDEVIRLTKEVKIKKTFNELVVTYPNPLSKVRCKRATVYADNLVFDVADNAVAEFLQLIYESEEVPFWMTYNVLFENADRDLLRIYEITEDNYRHIYAHDYTLAVLTILDFLGLFDITTPDVIQKIGDLYGDINKKYGIGRAKN